MPEGLKEPELHDVELFYWKAFWLLHTERQVGNSAWYIPYSKIRDAYRDMRVGDEASFVDIIRAMDICYVEHSNAALSKTGK